VDLRKEKYLMGIDYLSCKNCGKDFPDVIDYVSCDCGEEWCSEKCAEADGFKDEWCSKHDLAIEEVERDIECGEFCWQCEFYSVQSCKYCREEDFDNDTLLEFALNELGLTREELVSRYKK
jgi:hypothetical protein